MVNTGGPAFPLAHEIPPDPSYPAGTRGLRVYDGMTLRDYFAAKVCAALCQYEEFFPPAVAAKRAYEYADAMLKQREKP